MNLSWPRIKYRLGIINHDVEFSLILSWMLFFPVKQSYFYFLGTAAILCFFIGRNITFMKTFGVSPFKYSLPLVSFLLILTSFFSVNYSNSLLLTADILLIICYFLLFYNDPRKLAGHFRITAYIISAFSAIIIIFYFKISLPFITPGQSITFFASTIHEGIISGMGVLILLFLLLQAREDNTAFSKQIALLYISLILLNLFAVYVSQSKAAYLGTILFALLMLLLKKKKWILYLTILVVLTFIIPNPIRSMVHRSLTRDPYATNRIDIWKMSLQVIKDYPLTGVGLDNFSEVAARYNFKQTKGPANYFKVPHNTHNDYLKVLTETGLIGFAIIAAIFFFLVKRLFASSLFDITKILLLYLLFQAFLFNILFTTFFLFVFLFLLKNLLEENVTFRSFSLPFKLSLSCLLIIIFLAAYLFPWLSHRYNTRARHSGNPIKTFQLLDRAALFNPLDSAPYIAKAEILLNYFRETSNLEAFYSAGEQLQIARSLRSQHIDTYLLAVRLYLEFLDKKVGFNALQEEIIAIIQQAEIVVPLNPFLQLTKARVYLAFDQKDNARKAAEKAIQLEPEYVAALYFLHTYFNYVPETPEFTQIIAKIQAKLQYWQPEKEHYLYRLWEIPAGEVSHVQN